MITCKIVIFPTLIVSRGLITINDALSMSRTVALVGRLSWACLFVVRLSLGCATPYRVYNMFFYFRGVLVGIGFVWDSLHAFGVVGFLMWWM